MEIFENLESEVEDLKKSFYNMAKFVPECEKIVEECSQRMDSFQTSIDESSQEIATIATTAGDHSQKIENLQTTIGYTSAKVDEIEESVDELLQRVSKIENSGSSGSTDVGSILTFFPVGAVYLSVNNTSPASFIGGIWELLETDKALWTSDSNGGSTIEASIPNINGTLGTLTFRGEWMSSGAFSIDNTDTSYGHANGSSNHRSSVTFNANNGASVQNIYKDTATTVQPPAIRVFAWKRIA